MRCGLRPNGQLQILGQKQIDHMVQMKKINSDVGKGFTDRGRMGYGRSIGRYCWR